MKFLSSLIALAMLSNLTITQNSLAIDEVDSFNEDIGDLDYSDGYEGTNNDEQPLQEDEWAIEERREIEKAAENAEEAEKLMWQTSSYSESDTADDDLDLFDDSEKKKFVIKLHKSGNQVDKQKKFLQAFKDLKAENYHLSKKLYKEIADKNPADHSALFGLAASCQGLQEYEQALSLYVEIIKSNNLIEKSVNNMLSIISMKPNRDNLLKLIEVFEKYAHSSRLAAQIAVTYSHLNQLEKAINYMNIAINLNPRDIRNYYNLGLITEMNGDKERALSIYMHALNKPNSYTAGNNDNIIPEIHNRVNQLRNNMEQTTAF